MVRRALASLAPAFAAMDAALEARRASDAVRDLRRWISSAREDDAATSSAAREGAKAGVNARATVVNESDAARERGNAAYRDGRYEDAIEAYGESVRVAVNASALANRAMCWLKLGEWTRAEADCDAALGMDDGALAVKCLQRRGLARRELKKYLESVMDFEEAVRLEPKSKILREERAKSQKAFELESKLRPTQTRFRIPLIDGDASDVASREVPASSASKASEVEASSSPPTSGGTSSSAPTARERKPVATACDDIVEKAAAIAASKPIVAPKSAAEFERAYRAEMNSSSELSEARRAEIIALVPIDRVPAFFPSGIEPDVLADVSTIALERRFPSDANDALAWLECTLSLPRFAVSVALRPRAATPRLAAAFDTAARLAPEFAARLNELRRAYRA